MLDTIGAFDRKRLSGKKIFVEAHNKQSKVLPFYTLAPKWQSEYVEVYRKPDEQTLQK